MSEGTAAFGNVETKLTLHNFDLWYGRSAEDGFTLNNPMLYNHMSLSRDIEEDGFDIGDTVPVDGLRVLYYEEYGRGMDSRYLRDIYQVARTFKKREWGIVLLTFDGRGYGFEKAVSLGPDVEPLFDGDAKDFFTETVAVYMGPQLAKGPHVDYGPMLVPISHPYIAPRNWKPEYWAL